VPLCGKSKMQQATLVLLCGSKKLKHAYTSGAKAQCLYGTNGTAEAVPCQREADGNLLPPVLLAAQFSSAVKFLQSRGFFTASARTEKFENHKFVVVSVVFRVRPSELELLQLFFLPPIFCWRKHCTP
jgi:hypothetical protein